MKPTNNLTDGYKVIAKNLVVNKKKDIRGGYSKHSITILLKEPNEVRFYWEKDNLGEKSTRVFTFFKENVERRDEESDVGPNEVEYKILGKIRWMKNTDDNPNDPKKGEMKKRISFKFLKNDNPNYELANIHNFLKFNHVNTLIETGFSGRKTVAFDPETGDQLVGGKRRKTRKQRKSRKGGKKSRKQRKSRKGGKKSHKRRTRKRRTR